MELQLPDKASLLHSLCLADAVFRGCSWFFRFPSWPVCFYHSSPIYVLSTGLATYTRTQQYTCVCTCCVSCKRRGQSRCWEQTEPCGTTRVPAWSGVWSRSPSWPRPRPAPLPGGACSRERWPGGGGVSWNCLELSPSPVGRWERHDNSYSSRKFTFWHPFNKQLKVYTVGHF